MKTLIESLLNDEDILIKDTSFFELINNIPNSPKVSKNEMMYYYQAWLFIFREMEGDIFNAPKLTSLKNFQHKYFLKLFKEWMPTMKCIPPAFGDINDIKTNDIKKFIIKYTKAFPVANFNFLQHKIDSILKQENVTRGDIANFDVMFFRDSFKDGNWYFSDLLENSTFDGPECNKYYNMIKKQLKLVNIDID